MLVHDNTGVARRLNAEEFAAGSVNVPSVIEAVISEIEHTSGPVEDPNDPVVALQQYEDEQETKREE